VDVTRARWKADTRTTSSPGTASTTRMRSVIATVLASPRGDAQVTRRIARRVAQRRQSRRDRW
jgi:hypothetical protein